LGVVFFLCVGRSSADPEPNKLGGVYLSLGDLENPYFMQIARGAEAKAKQINPAVKFTAEADNYDSGTQIKQLDAAIAAGVNLIILNAVDPGAVAPSIQKAKAAGIKVIGVAQPFPLNVDHAVVSDQRQAGQLGANYIAKRLNGQGNIVIVNGPPVPAVQERVAGFLDAIGAFPNIKILSRDQSGNASREGGLRVMADLLAAYPKIDAVFAVNDPTALGCDAAARQAKRNEFFIVGIDGGPDIVAALKDSGSLIAATAAEDPALLGSSAVEIGYAILSGNPPDGQVTKIPVTLVTRENLADYKGWAK
jgi:ribose transport system substrate-binding protein